MLQRFLLSILIFSFVAAGCNRHENQTDNDSVARTAATDTSQSDPVEDAGSADTIPARGYEPNGSDTATSDRIKKVLPEILKKELEGADSTARRFIYHGADLNGDGEKELFVGFTGMNWCGSGGCTALLLSSKGELITHFTVAGFPFMILEEQTNGWKNLGVYSGRANRLLKWDGKSYPKNPSVAPKYSGNLSGDLQKALDFPAKSYPWFTF